MHENLAFCARDVEIGGRKNSSGHNGGAEDGYDHKDIRDNAVRWYFALPAGRFKTFSVQLRAAYEGRFALPATVVEAMYEPTVQAATAAGTALVQP